MPEQRAFAEKLTLRVLTDTKHHNSAPGTPVSYFDLAELIALLNEPRTTDALLDFIARYPGSADETRSFAVARLYELRTHLVLERLSSRSEPDQKIITSSIAWGLANNHYLFINLDNYTRVAVGPHWEVLEDEHPHRKLSKRIDDELRQLVERQERLDQAVKRAE